MQPFDPVLGAIARVAVDATGAVRGWVLSLRGDTLQVVAAAGVAAEAALGVEIAAGEGVAGLVVGANQPMALTLPPGDPLAGSGVAGRTGDPMASVCCVPCGDESPLGVLEVVDKAGGGSFTFDDVELVSLLAVVAGAALSTHGESEMPAPATLARDLEALAVTRPDRYAAAATLLSALLGDA